MAHLAALVIASCAIAVAGMRGGIGGMPKADSREGLYEIHVTVAWVDVHMRQQVVEDTLYRKTPGITEADLIDLHNNSVYDRKPSIIEVVVKGKWENGKIVPYRPT